METTNKREKDMNFIDILKKDNIPTDSYMSAINYIVKQEERNGKFTVYEYRSKIIELTGFGGFGRGLAECGMAEYTYKYVIQESMKEYAETKKPVDMAKMYTYAVDKARAFLDDNPQYTSPKPIKDGTGNIKKKQ